MPHEIEPSQPNERSIGESETLSQQWVVEALITDTSHDRQQYIVTNVISGFSRLYGRDYPPLHSTAANFALSPEQLMDSPYRSLVSDPHYNRIADASHYDLDELLQNNEALQVGDRITIERWLHKVPTGHNAWSGNSIENVTVIERSVDITAEEDKALERKQYIRENLAAILRRLEYMQLERNDRLQTGVETTIAWSHDERSDISRAEFVYGENSIEDHFVNLVARPYSPIEEVPLGGDTRYTYSGNAFVARDVIAGVPSKELVKLREPVVELSAHVWTKTALNPEVDTVVVGFIVDGIHYIGVKDDELSSHYFEAPGHDLVFNAFTIKGEVFDGVALTTQELDALAGYGSVVHELTMRAVYYGLDARIIRGEIEQGASVDLVPVHENLQKLELVKADAFKDLLPVIDGIKARPSDTKMGIGGRLLVPVSKLGDVKVIVTKHA